MIASNFFDDKYSTVAMKVCIKNILMEIIRVTSGMVRGEMVTIFMPVL